MCGESSAGIGWVGRKDDLLKCGLAVISLCKALGSSA